MRRADIICPFKAKDFPEGTYVLVRTYEPYLSSIFGEFNIAVAMIHNRTAYSAALSCSGFGPTHFFRTTGSICCVLPECEINELEKDLIRMNIEENRYNCPNAYMQDKVARNIQHRFRMYSGKKTMKSLPQLYQEYASGELCSLDELDE